MTIFSFTSPDGFTTAIELEHSPSQAPARRTVTHQNSPTPIEQGTLSRHTALMVIASDPSAWTTTTQD